MRHAYNRLHAYPDGKQYGAKCTSRRACIGSILLNSHLLLTQRQKCLSDRDGTRVLGAWSALRALEKALEPLATRGGCSSTGLQPNTV